MKKLLQYCDELPRFSASGIGITSEPLIPQHLRFYSAGSAKGGGVPCSHGRYILNYLLQGERTINIDGTLYSLRKGDAILIPPGAFVKTDSSDNSITLNAAFELPAKEQRLRRICKNVFRPSAKDQQMIFAAVTAF